MKIAFILFSMMFLGSCNEVYDLDWSTRNGQVYYYCAKKPKYIFEKWETLAYCNEARECQEICDKAREAAKKK